MTPAEPIRLIIIRGDECIHEKEGHYDIWTFSKANTAPCRRRSFTSLLGRSDPWDRLICGPIRSKR